MSNIWKPQPKQELFLSNPAFECGYGGAKGGGKSDSLIIDGLAQINNPNYKAILFRRTFKQLEDIYSRTCKFFKNKATYNGEKRLWTFKNGAKFYLSHCQHEKDKENHQGQEYHWMGFDQLEQFTSTMYEYLKMQVRSTDPTIRCYVRSSFNPGGIGHTWVKNHFIDSCAHDGKVRFFIKENDQYKQVLKGTPFALSRAFVFASIYDNDYLLKNDPQYLANLKSLPEKLRKAMELGDWDVFDGQYFTEFDRRTHVISLNDYFRLIEGRNITRFASLDYGFSAPSCVLWHCVLPEGKIITYRELYEKTLTYTALADLIMERSRNEHIDYLVCDPAIQGDKQHHQEPKDGMAKGESGFEAISKVLGGKIPCLLADNRRVIGWTRMHEYLEPYKNQFNEIDVRLQITDNCKNLIRTLPAMIHDDTNLEDVDSSTEDHPPDALRYGIMTRPEIPRQEFKPLTKEDVFWQKVKKDILKNKKNNLHNDENIASLDEDMGFRMIED